MPHSTPPRWRAVSSLLLEQKLDALLVVHPPNVRYLTGFTGSNGSVLVAPGHARLFTDPRYGIQAGLESSCPVRVVRGPSLDAAAKAIRQRQWRRVGFESTHVTYQGWELLTGALPARSELVPVTGLVEGLRTIKSREEISAIAAAVKLNSEAFERTVGIIRPGIREQELAAELDYQMRQLGASGPAFDTIVAFGPRTALPHATPGARKLSPRQLVLVDMGAMREGYASDMTRMLYLGTPSTRVKQLYNAVRDAQQAALSEVKDGVPAAHVDSVARRTLRAYGLERLFVHSTGHGLGLEIHESPRLGHPETAKLAAGMVVTIEPGVYWEGFGGIRIEDTVVVTRTGCRNLTPTPKDLLLL